MARFKQRGPIDPYCAGSVRGFGPNRIFSLCFIESFHGLAHLGSSSSMETPKEEAAVSKTMEVGCARPTGGPVGETPDEGAPNVHQPAKEAMPMIRVGRKAPDFVAPAYQQGKFVSIRLSEYLGKWVLLCFYPGDFTFV